MLFVEMKTLKSDFDLTLCHVKMSYLMMPLDNLFILLLASFKKNS